LPQGHERCNSQRLKAPGSVIAIAVVLLIASVSIPAWAIYRLFVSPTLRDLLWWIVLASQLVFGSLGIVTSIGLLRMHEAARKAAIFLATAPLCILVLALFVLLAAARSTHGLVFAAAFLAFGALLLILIPISTWWLVVLRRDSVRSQFR
jgi:O-antigen/teichoic acid export membrane protein